MKKQYVLKNRKRFIVSILLVALILISLFIVQTVDSYSESKYITVTVSKGDTLWDIALYYCNDSDARRVVYEIKLLNNLDNDTIYTGQELVIPVKYYPDLDK